MLRSDYKYSRESSIESTATEKESEDFGSSPGRESASGGGSASSRRSASMKQWSPLAALGRKARDGLRRCNTVRVGLSWGGGGGNGNSTVSALAKSSDDSGSGEASTSGSSDRARRNAMPNIFLGLPSSGVHRLYAIYGIDDTRGVGCRGKSTTATGRGAEESLFARHTRTSSVRSRPPGYMAGAGAMQYQQMLMMQQQLQLHHPQQHQPGQLDRRRASSMRDHGRSQRVMTSYGNG